MSSFRSGAFRWLWTSTVAASAGAGMYGTATAWLALDSAGGPFSVGLVLAARMLPGFLFGLAAGTLADRIRRNRLLATVSLAAVPIMLALSWLAGSGTIDVWQLVVLSFATGCVPVFDIPARQALVMETVPREVGPNAMALNALAGRLSTALGALVAGTLIPAVGVPSCYVVIALTYVTAATLVAFVRPGESRSGGEVHQLSSFGRALSEAARLVFDVPAVRTLILASIACEVFGFSFMTAVPAFARDVLDAGAEGLGTLNAATSVGASLAVVVLSVVPGHVRREPLLGLVFVLYGASLVALASTRELAIAAAVLLVTGACASSFDLLQQTLIQLAVPKEQRGRAVGVWVFGIGSGPLGHLEMGSMVVAFGAPLALAVNGCVVLAAAATLLARSPGYRWSPESRRLNARRLPWKSG